MGLGGALFEQIDFADGKILNPNFADYRLPRFRDAPLLETVLLDRKDLPSEVRARRRSSASHRPLAMRSSRPPASACVRCRWCRMGCRPRRSEVAFAIVPAGGNSTRMGRPKLTLPLGNTTVIGRVVSTLRAGGVERIVVVVGPHVNELIPLAQAAGADVLALSEPTPDMRTTVERGLEWIGKRCCPAMHDWWFLAPADHPAFAASVISNLLSMSDEARRSIIVPTHNGQRATRPFSAGITRLELTRCQRM